MRRDESSKKLRDMVETMVADIGDQAKLEADRYRQYPEEFEWDFEARWNRILGANYAAAWLGLKSPLTYSGRSYSRKSVLAWAWELVLKHAGRQQGQGVKS